MSEMQVIDAMSDVRRHRNGLANERHRLCKRLMEIDRQIHECDEQWQRLAESAPPENPSLADTIMELVPDTDFACQLFRASVEDVAGPIPDSTWYATLNSLITSGRLERVRADIYRKQYPATVPV